MTITETIKYVGVNDHKLDLFESQFNVKNGMAYNSYLILDDKIAIFDTVEAKFYDTWIKNIKLELKDRLPDYLIISHMEPDHSAHIEKFMSEFKKTIIVSNTKVFTMIKNYFGEDYEERRIIVNDNDKLCLGKHTLNFIFTPMVHWPEVMMTYEESEKVLFSADAFGKFGAVDNEDNWIDEARRYYFGIVGKYGLMVQNVLKKASNLDIKTICPLHGPVIKENIQYYFNLYNTWSNYAPEIDGIFIPYTSVYGHTKNAVELLKEKLNNLGQKNVITFDLARNDMSEAIANAFKYSKIVFATTTYNMDIFPFMSNFLHAIVERNFQNRTVAFIENGSWVPNAMKVMKTKLENCKNIKYTSNNITILSNLTEKNCQEIINLAEELI